MTRRFPLYLQILLWLCLNLLLLGTVAALLLAGHFGLDLLVVGRAGDRIRGLRDVIRAELQSQPLAAWDGVLEHYSSIYRVNLTLFHEDGSQLAGRVTQLPAAVLVKLAENSPDRRTSGGPNRDEFRPEGPGPERRGPGENRLAEEGREPPAMDPHSKARPDFFEEHGPNDGRFRRKGGRAPESGSLSQPRFVLRTADPTRYWVGLLSFLPDPKNQPRQRSLLLIEADSIHGHGLFFDPTPVLVVGGGALLVSVLFWFPLVRRITQALGQMTRATERIAQGHFDGRVNLRRRDELGQLGDAVNLMAGRLEGFVTGQKRFLGDIAHELCSPIARCQMAIGILEQRADVAAQSYVQDVREEIQQMSELVAELLSFSKASLAGAEVKRQSVNVREIIEQAVRRDGQGVEIRLDLDDELAVLASPELFQRALSNLLRNAVRYAGDRGPITITARRDGPAVVIAVGDCGPGVSEQLLQRLFDPFFRVDDARTRESGGVGLGLTIVKTCVEACGGTVACRNLSPSGLEVAIRLQTAEDPRPHAGRA